jgi:hypothetical protein
MSTTEVLRVVSQETQDELYSSGLGSWFHNSLLARTALHASRACPELAGVRAQATIQTVAKSGMVSGWQVKLRHDQESFQTHWPIQTLALTARSIGQQMILGNGQVVYWVEQHATEKRDAAIEFDDDTLSVVVPNFPTRDGPPEGRLLTEVGYRRPEVILLLHHGPLEVLLSGVEERADKELAWAGSADLWRFGNANANEETMVFELSGEFRPLPSPQATATLCPIDAGELASVYPAPAPDQARGLVIAHSHLAPEQPVSDSFLTPSQDDYRMMHQLPVGTSLGLVVASRPPLRARALGWPGDGSDVRELSTAVMLAD